MPGFKLRVSYTVDLCSSARAIVLANMSLWKHPTLCAIFDLSVSWISIMKTDTGPSIFVFVGMYIDWDCIQHYFIH